MADKTKDPTQHPDHPDYMHPDAEKLPKTVILHRKDQHPITAQQTVTVNAEDKVHDILAKTNFPKAALISPVSGYKIDPSDFLYRHVKHGGTVEVAE